MTRYFPDKEITRQIIGAAFEVHTYWGPGLYEEIYERSLCAELRSRGVAVETQVHIPIIYKGIRVGDDLRLDLFVENKVIVEVKCVKRFLPVHTAQLLTYLKLTNRKIGLLLNFHTDDMKEGGIQRVAN